MVPGALTEEHAGPFEWGQKVAHGVKGREDGSWEDRAESENFR